MQGLYNIVTKVQPVTNLLIATALIICGIMFIVPSEKINEKAKSKLPYIALGAGIILGAMSIANEVSSSFVF